MLCMVSMLCTVTYVVYGQYTNICCVLLHARSLYLHKLGKAPEIENLVGTVTFSGKSVRLPQWSHLSLLRGRD